MKFSDMIKWMVLAAVWAATTALPAHAAKVAVIDLTHSPDTEALLTAALAKQDGLEVLERAQLSKLVEEKQLNDLAAAGKFSALGKLLGADGLVVLDRIVLPGNTTTPGTAQVEPTARLIATATGACLFLVELPQPNAGLIGSAEWVAHRVADAQPAMNAPGGQDMAISVLNLRTLLNQSGPIFQSKEQKLRDALKRLLEAHLANLPGFVLLERRQLGDAAFEKSLDAADAQPFLQSQLQVEAELTDWQPPGNFTLQLWLRRGDGTRLGPAQVEGSPGNVPAVADKMIAEIGRLVGLTAGATVAPAHDEGARFTHEAYWALGGGDVDAAHEAMATAAALGDQSPDASIMQSLLAYTDYRAAFGTTTTGSFVVNTPLRRGASPFDPERQSALLEEALTAYAAFQSGGGKVLANSRLGYEPAFPFGASFPNELTEDAAAYLQICDEQGLPGMEELRRLARQPIAVDSAAPENPLLLVRYGPALARDADQLVAWYERALFHPPLDSDQLYLARAPGYDSSKTTTTAAAMLLFIPDTPAAALGRRFADEPAAVQKFHAMLDRALEATPAVQARALLVQAGFGDQPGQLETYRKYLALVATNATVWEKSGELDSILSADVPHDQAGWQGGLGPRQRQLYAPAARERAAMLIQVLQVLTGFHNVIGDEVSRVTMPADLWPEFVRAYTDYRTRCLAAARVDNRPALQRDFGYYDTALRKNHPGLTLPSAPAPPDVAPAGPPLVVRTFWSFAQAGAPPAPINRPTPIAHLVVSDDTAWVWNIVRAESGQTAETAFEVALATMTTRPVGLPGLSSVTASPDELWINCSVNDGASGTKFSLVRRDRRTGADTAWPMDGSLAVTSIGGRVFLWTFQTAASNLYEFNPADGQRTLLASQRREPAQSPLDGLPTGNPLFGLDANGPVLVQMQYFGNFTPAYEVGGDWKRSYPGFEAARLRGNESLLLDHQKGVFWLQPGAAAPVPLVMPQADGTVKMLHDWQWGAPWNYTADALPQLSFHDGRLFRLESDGSPNPAGVMTGELAPNNEAPRYLRWWYEGGPPEGIRIPVLGTRPSPNRIGYSQDEGEAFPSTDVTYSDGALFRLETETVPVAPSSPRGNNTANQSTKRVFLHWWREGGPPAGWRIALQFDSPPATTIAASPAPRGGAVPNSNRTPDHLNPAPSGLVLSGVAGGFWFIPNADLDAYRQAYLAQQTQAAPPPPNSAAPNPPPP